MIAGADAGSKLDRATELNVPVLDEEGFKNLLANKGVPEGDVR